MTLMNRTTIPSGFIEQVRNGIDIVDVVSPFVPLKRAGKNFKGLCPFHTEKTPSFNVSPDRQIFHCFGCGEGGDVFKFLMLYEKMSFLESVRHLASRAGLTLPETRREVVAAEDERGSVLRLYDEAARFFQHQLGQKLGRTALDYLRKRGLQEETLDGFGIGYAPDAWSALLEHLTRRGARPEELARAGLVAPRRSGNGYYDRFRNRVIIPIRNESGRVVAFGGRLLGAGEPKYLNSPEHPAYNKSRILFGFDRAKPSIRETGFAILMEGYMDCIQAAQNGIQNAVACCGTSLTGSHARLLRRYTDRVVVNFDPDAAGRAATRRSVDLLLEEGFQVSVLTLPANDDPDSFIRKRGREAYVDELSRAASFMDYLIDEAVRHHDVKSPRGKADFLNAVLPTLARIPSHVERVAHVSQLAERAEISDAAIVEELRRQVMARASHVDLAPAPRSAVRPAERDLVRWLLQTPEMAAGLLAGIDEEDLRDTSTGAILRVMREIASSGDLTTERVLDRLTAEADRKLLTRIAMDPAPLGPRQSPQDCLNRLREQRWRRRISELRTQLGRGADDDHITAEIQSLARRIENLGRLSTFA